MSETLVIACKLPTGLLLEHGKRGDADYKCVRVRGPRDPERMDGMSVTAVGGYGFTPNVDAAFYYAWLKAHKDIESVRKGMIFSATNLGEAQAKALAFAENRSGLEPLTRKDMPVGVTPEVGTNQAA